MRTSFKIGKVLGIPIKVHISLLVMVLFLAQDFGWLNGLLIEIGLATSIVLHELGHSVVAIWKGCRVREITLMFIGGAAQMERIPSRPLDEFLMAIAGPVVSLLLGFACFYGGAYLPLAPMAGFPVNIVQLIGIVNFGLAFFNLLPSFPMDGGRVLRAVLTPRMGRLRATYVAARLGKIMAIMFGLYAFLSTPTKWVLVAIAIFIYTAAGNEYRMVQIREQAKRQGGHGPTLNGHWHDGDGDGGADGDQVAIGPPPYNGGRGSRSEARPTKGRDNGFPFGS